MVIYIKSQNETHKMCDMTQYTICSEKVQSDLSIIAVFCTQNLSVKSRPVVIIKRHCATEKDVSNDTNSPHINLCCIWQSCKHLWQPITDLNI